MNIVSHELRPLRWSLTPATRNAHGQWTERCGLELRVEDEEGRVGLGEASPLPGYSPDTLQEAEAAISALSAKTWAALASQGASVGGVSSWLDSLGPLPPSARCALETALLDLLGQRSAQPIWSLLAQSHAAPSAVPLTCLLSPTEPESAIEQGREALEGGIQALKVKLGTQSHADDLSFLERLRGDLGHTFQLRLDANRSWGHDLVAERLSDLEPFAPQFLEEPLRDGPLSIALDSPIPLALDESLQEEPVRDQLERVLEQGCWSAVVLKPMALGGLLPCLELAERAYKVQVKSCVSHTWGHHIAQTANRHLALALPAPLACAIGPLPEDHRPQDEANAPQSHIHPQDQPGLGWNMPRT